MAITIENQKMAATINEHGAELVSLINKTNGKEYMWSGDAKYWGRHAPVLFPTVGRLKDDTYTVDGQEYHMNQHGFARDMDFDVLKVEADQVVLELHSSDQTKKLYPYDFILRLAFKLTDNGVQVGYEVENPADEEMWFGIGGHPAFKVPMDGDHFYDDYVVKLEPQTNRNIIPLNGPYADIDHLKEERTSEIEVSHERFKDDAVILDLGEGPTTVTLTDNDQRHGVQLKTADAKYIGVWSCYPQEGQYVCLEPWWSIADTVDSDHDFKHKFANNHLAAHQTFKTEYEIDVF